VPLSVEELGPQLTQFAKFDLDPSNRLATIHQRHRQTGQRPIAYGKPFYKRLPNKSNSNFFVKQNITDNWTPSTYLGGRVYAATESSGGSGS